MRRILVLLPALLLAPGLSAQAPAPEASAQVAGPSAQSAQSVLRAQYSWGYVDSKGQGKGTFNILVEPATGRVVMELQGLGERLMLLQGESAGGYRVQIPREKLDTTAATLGAVPLPFFPQVGSADALYRLLSEGEGPGVKVTKRDQDGPVKMRYQGVDDRGKEVMVWLERTRWENKTGS